MKSQSCVFDQTQAMNKKRVDNLNEFNYFPKIYIHVGYFQSFVFWIENI